MADKKTFSLAEVKKHNNATSSWLVIHKKVYDVTKFLDEHPGGAEILVENAGLPDASAEFDSIGHSSAALEMLKSYYIGDVEESK